MELTAEEGKLLLQAAGRLADKFVCSGATVPAVPQLDEAWKRNAATLRNLAIRLTTLK